MGQELTSTKTQLYGDLIIEGYYEQHGQVTGVTIVRRGGGLLCHGQLAGGLVIEEGGYAIVYGQISRNIVNYGRLTLFGQTSGRVLGSPPTNAVDVTQIGGTDLDVSFGGTTYRL